MTVSEHAKWHEDNGLSYGEKDLKWIEKQKKKS
jgi:hypothetical protein